MNHAEGQYRAELFDEFVYQLLIATYPGKEHLLRNAVFAAPSEGPFNSVSVDFVVDLADGEILVETKAPYTKAAADAIGRALDRLVASVHLVSQTAPVREVILAIPMDLPERSMNRVEHARMVLAPVQLNIWDAATLRRLSIELLKKEVGSFSVPELEKIVGSRKQRLEEVTGSAADRDRLPVGAFADIVVLSADFCSFSSFVRASGADTELISSVMGRFYRETREAIRSNGGVLDKYMGDGILCYWFNGEAGKLLEKCVARLIGIALNIAEEWQDQIDIAVTPKGLRAGAAIGAVLFIEERPGDVHAIGDSINMSARLQSCAPADEVAPPNCLVIANRLRGRHFANRDDYGLLGAVHLKNIGDVIAWRKSFVDADIPA